MADKSVDRYGDGRKSFQCDGRLTGVHRRGAESNARRDSEDEGSVHNSGFCALAALLLTQEENHYCKKQVPSQCRILVKSQTLTPSEISSYELVTSGPDQSTSCEKRTTVCNV